MINGFNVIVDVKSEIYNFIKDLCDSTFEDFATHESVPNSVYVLGHTQASDNIERFKQMAIDPRFLMIYCNSNEGSKILLNRLRMLGLDNPTFKQRILSIATGHMDESYRHMSQEYWLHKVYQDPRNSFAIEYIDVFDKLDKPYTFLFLNGSARPHRKYLIEQFRKTKLLNNSLWTCLDSQNSASPHFSLSDNRMFSPNIVRWLPPHYEINESLTEAEFISRYTQRVPPQDRQFDRLGRIVSPRVEMFLKPEPYEDTYFSLVTETQYEYPYSFRTEKIAKPLAVGHPWIVAANRGFYRDMRNIGFKTFEGIIDESFDLIDNHQDRMERIVQVVDDLCSNDLNSFLTSCKDICKYNQQHLKTVAENTVKEMPERFTNFIKTNVSKP
jgi:hypothetical protein